jgi:Region found in RelA / SpoT proteins
MLASELHWVPEDVPSIKRAFEVAHCWRHQHMQPMLHYQRMLVGRIRRLHLDGITASRAKSMASIRRKLGGTQLKLDRIQDLGGCRAIVKNSEQLQCLVKAFRSEMSNSIERENDYVTRPKADGYRSHHFILKHRIENSDFVINERYIEVQLRTRLQHSWATAVEAVGAFRNELLKHGNGSPDWLRLFSLMSQEIALVENTPLPKLILPNDRRQEEIRSIAARLDALKYLDTIRYSVGEAKSVSDYDPNKPRYFLVTFDHDSREVETVIHNPRSGAASFIETEMQTVEHGFRRTTVLVNVLTRIISGTFRFFERT